MSDIREQKIAALKEEIDILMSQWKGTLSDEERERISARIEAKSKQIEKIKQKRKSINLAETDSVTGNIRQGWQDRLIEIDFKEVKTLIENFNKDIFQNSDEDRRYALWLLENAFVMEGALILRWLENYLRAKFNSWTQPFVYGFTTTANKEDFIRALAKEYGISPETELSKMISLIRAKFYDGEVFFININIPTDSGSDFLVWFVKEFWQPFVQDLNGKFTVVGVISLDCQLKSEDSLDEIVCKLKLDRQKIIRLELETWTQEDIEIWLRNHSGLGRKGCDMAKFKEVAEVVWKMAEGKPDSTLNALVKILKRLLAEANQKEESA